MMLGVSWPDLITTVGGAAALVAALAWTGRTILLHLLSKDVEEFKARLAAQEAAGIEHLRSQLQILSKEHELRFGALHEKRATILAEMYYKLEAAMTTARLLRRVLQLELEEAKVKRWTDRLSEQSKDLFEYIQRNQLYLSEVLAARVREVFFSIQEPIPKLVLESAAADERWGDAQARRAQSVAYWQEKEPEIAGIMRSLEREFRLLLGSESALTREAAPS